MINTEEFFSYLKKRGLEFFVGVPDSLLKNICACIKMNSTESNNIIAANEGNAIGIASGYHISTGKFGVVYMQNSGQEMRLIRCYRLPTRMSTESPCFY